MNTKPAHKIQLLPEHIIDQIKAGEVIERPSTLIKEIIENSVDAGSTKIDLQFIENGLELISITDNGIGIKGEDLPLAFCRHATSKIDRFEDIYALSSYGFRGEALASIASISKITCDSTTANTKSTIRIEGGKTISHVEDSGSYDQVGTKVFIKDLFFNTPVRMKFIQSKTSEKNQIKKIINAFLLTQPHIQFSVRWDDSDREIYKVHPENSLYLRVADVLKKQKKSIELIKGEESYDGVEFSIFLSEESSRGNAHKTQFIFINNRFIQDIQIHKIILNSAKNLWPEGETGNYIAYLNLPSDEIDVNVHPNKTVVKLFQAPKAYSVISGTVKRAIPEKEEESIFANTRPVENELPLEAEASSFKSIQYNQYDFNKADSLDHYLDNIYTTNKESELPLESTAEVLIKDFEKISLYKIGQDVYILNKTILIQYQLQNYFKKPVPSDDITPLLVSRPLKVSRKFTEKELNSFIEFGFEIDSLDNETIIIRAFPSYLQGFPYIDLFQTLFDARGSFTDIKDEYIDFSEISISFIQELIKSLSFSQHIKNRSFVKIDEEKIGSLL